MFAEIIVLLLLVAFVLAPLCPLIVCLGLIWICCSWKVRSLLLRIFAGCWLLVVFADAVVVRTTGVDYCGDRKCTIQAPVCAIKDNFLMCRNLESQNSTVVDVDDQFDVYPVRVFVMQVSHMRAIWSPITPVRHFFAGPKNAGKLFMAIESDYTIYLRFPGKAHEIVFTTQSTSTQTHPVPFTQTPRHTSSQTSRHTSTETFTPRHTSTETSTPRHTSTQTSRTTQTHIHTDIQTLIHTDTRTHIHTQTHIHTYTDIYKENNRDVYLGPANKKPSTKRYISVSTPTLKPSLKSEFKWWYIFVGVIGLFVLIVFVYIFVKFRSKFCKKVTYTPVIELEMGALNEGVEAL